MQKKRQVHETYQDMQRERKVQERLCKYVARKTKGDGGNVKVIPMPRMAGFDCIVTRRGLVVCISEIKIRTSGAGKYSKYLISVRKILELKNNAQAMNTTAILLVEFSDCTMYVDITKLNLASIEIKSGGRKDRGDAEDIEPCFMIPMGKFTKMEA